MADVKTTPSLPQTIATAIADGDMSVTDAGEIADAVVVDGTISKYERDTIKELYAKLLCWDDTYTKTNIQRDAVLLVLSPIKNHDTENEKTKDIYKSPESVQVLVARSLLDTNIAAWEATHIVEVALEDGCVDLAEFDAIRHLYNTLENNAYDDSYYGRISGFTKNHKQYESVKYTLTSIPGVVDGSNAGNSRCKSEE